MPCDKGIPTISEYIIFFYGGTFLNLFGDLAFHMIKPMTLNNVYSMPGGKRIPTISEHVIFFYRGTFLNLFGHLAFHMIKPMTLNNVYSVPDDKGIRLYWNTPIAVRHKRASNSSDTIPPQLVHTNESHIIFRHDIWDTVVLRQNCV